MTATGVSGSVSAIRAILPSQVSVTPPARQAAEIVGVALERPAAGEQVLELELLLRPLRSGDHPERDRRRARAEAARARDPVRPLEAQPFRRGDEPERADADVRRVGRLVGALRHLDLVPEIERDAAQSKPGPRLAVVAGARTLIGARRLRVLQPVAGEHADDTRPAGRTCATPATPAADAGSQKSALEPHDRRATTRAAPPRAR